MHVGDVVQANILAATTENPEARNQVYNIGTGQALSLNELFALFKRTYPDLTPTYREARVGDAPASCPDIAKARDLLDYEPQYSILTELEGTLKWYAANLPALRRFGT